MVEQGERKPEAPAEIERVVLTPKQVKARRMRSIAIALVLGFLVILFYAYTIRYFGSPPPQ